MYFIDLQAENKLDFAFFVLKNYHLMKQKKCHSYIDLKFCYLTESKIYFRNTNDECYVHFVKQIVDVSSFICG